jgi:putative ABC transport system ATP-binding protein
MEMNNSEIISLENVSKVYHQGNIDVNALMGISFKMTKGDFAVVSGPSGSGKTTLLNILGALDVPSSGRVLMEGKELSSIDRTALSAIRRDRIGFVFQSYNLIPVLTAYENAEFVLAIQGVPSAERRERVMAILKDVGLEGLDERRPHELSGGQQQRVAIARAIVTNPAVVLADEPTANIDSHTADSLLDMMETLNHDKAITFLFSTHDPRVMERAHRIIRLTDGTLVSDEKTGKHP